MSTIAKRANTRIALIGAGHLGTSVVKGLLHPIPIIEPSNLYLTKRRPSHISSYLSTVPITVTADHLQATSQCSLVILAVPPSQLVPVINEISPAITSSHTLISLVTGVSLSTMSKAVLRPPSEHPSLIRAMPNIAIAYRQSMTCIAYNELCKSTDAAEVTDLLSQLGKVKKIREEDMNAATALTGCGMAFLLRAIRAAAQGGVEIGFHSEDAVEIVSQVSLGAATMVLESGGHPEEHIDKVTTPKGITISGLNIMEHNGFSSAMIKGVVASWEKANKVLGDSGGK